MIELGVKSKKQKVKGGVKHGKFSSLFTIHPSLTPAFTLAEVLITLTIIGVVAAITIPTLMNNIQDAQYKTAYKKAYSVINQALMKATQDGDIIPLTGVMSEVGDDTNFLAIKNQFVVSKECTTATLSNCWNPSGELWRYEGSSPAFIDNSGMAWKQRAHSGTSPVILVDTNGNKGPNQYGVDRFPFLYTTKNGTTYVSYIATDMGIPTKLMPVEDIVGSDPNSPTICASVAKHACYYTSWLMGN